MAASAWATIAAWLSAPTGSVVSQSARIRWAEWCSETKRTLRVVWRVLSITRSEINGAELGERFINGAAGFVVADKTDENALRSKSRDVARDVAGATDLHRVVPDAQHRRRRLWGNPRDVAVDEVVEHDVADAKDRLSGNEPQRLFKIKHRCARAAHVLLLTDGDRRDRDIR